MTDLCVLGTDTDAGKTTFAFLWMSRFHERYAYWKPLETGPGDSGAIARIIPGSRVHPPVMRFDEPVAPSLAAQRKGQAIPSARAIAAARPPITPLLIETFGGPFSPLNDTELQVDLIRLLDAELVLVTSSSVGAVGRMLAMIHALASCGLRPKALVLIGPQDSWAEGEIRRRTGIVTFGLRAPHEFQSDPASAFSVESVRAAADTQAETLDRLANALTPTKSEPTDWLALDRTCVWHPYSPLRDTDEPLAVVGAEAEFLHLADGRRVIDGISSWWTTLWGHRHPPLMHALADASKQIDHVVFAGATHPWGASLAKELLDTAPWTGGRVFYSDNGSTAVEVALKMAYQYWLHRGEPNRTTFIGFENSYHGDTFGAMAMSRDPVFFAPFEPLLFRAEILPLDPERLKTHLAKHAHETAAILIEPILQAAGGMKTHSEGTLRELCDISRRHDVLFLVDEVATGLGRTGTFWAHTAAGIIPDAIASAKTLAGGILPLAATLVSPKLVEAFDHADRSRMFFHGHSFTAHPLACAVACANLPLVKAAVPTVPSAIETFWKQAFAGVEEMPGIRDVRIRGAVAAIEIDVPGGYLADVGRVMRRTALEHGVSLRPLGNVLYALPPWRTSRSSLERIALAMKAAVKAVGG
jgi:adenosylmethionine-8-amino-7-oxononanoate aminotransferase